MYSSSRRVREVGRRAAPDLDVLGVDEDELVTRAQAAEVLEGRLALGVAVLPELGEDRGMDRVEDYDRRRPTPVHERERLLEVHEAPGNDRPAPRWLRPDALHEHFDRVFAQGRPLVLGQVQQRARLDRSVRQVDGPVLWLAAAKSAALEDPKRRARGLGAEVRAHVVEPEAVLAGEVRLCSRVRGELRADPVGRDADVDEPDEPAVPKREPPREVVGHHPGVGRAPAGHRRVESGAPGQPLKVRGLRLTSARASEDEDAWRLFEVVDQRELDRSVVLDGRR